MMSMLLMEVNNMNKKYHIVELNKQGQTVLWVKAMTLRAAYDQLASLQARFPEKKFIIEVSQHANI